MASRYREIYDGWRRDPEAFWAQAARNRDFVVYHYDRIDRDALWMTVTRSFPELRATAATARA